MPQKESGTLFPGGIPEGYVGCERCGMFWPEEAREFHRFGCGASRPEPQFSPEGLGTPCDQTVGGLEGPYQGYTARPIQPEFSPEMVEPEDIEELETHPTAGHIRLSSPPRPDIFEEIRCRFTAHPPTRAQAERHKLIRSSATQFANLVANTVPESRERTLALTGLEVVVMYAIAGITRRL